MQRIFKLSHFPFQEARKTAISRSVDVDELEKGVKQSVGMVNVSSSGY